MSDGMRRELAYLSSHATNRYFIPNWGNISSYCGARGFCVYTRPCLAPQTSCRETCSTASDHTQRNHVRLNLPHKELDGSKN